jgi:hypothetical protein
MGVCPERGTLMRTHRFAILAVSIVALAASVRAQAPVAETDLTRLETTAGEIAKQIPALERTDASLAADVKKTLTGLQEDITYLKVKFRREGSVSRAEFGDVRDRLETLRLKAQVPMVTAQPTTADPVDRIYTVPVGTLLDVRLQTPLNSGTAKAEQRFEATTILDFTMNNVAVIPAGSIVRGFVSSVRAAGRIDRKGSLTLSFDELRVDNRNYKLRAAVEQALDGKTAQDTTRIGVGAAVGAIIGGILGGGKGALAGVLIGGGGTIASTEGADVDLPVGTILRLRVDQPLEIYVGKGLVNF